MHHELFGRAHAALVALREDVRGQGTVEYVGLILLVALVIGGVVVATQSFKGDDTIAKKLVDAVSGGIEDVTDKGRSDKK